MSTLAQKIKELRKQQGLTQEDLAQALHLTRSTVANWETGRGRPSIDDLSVLSRFFETTADYLVESETSGGLHEFVHSGDNLLFMGIHSGDRLLYIPGTTPISGAPGILNDDGRLFAAWMIASEGRVFFQSAPGSFLPLNRPIRYNGRVVRLERRYEIEHSED